MNRTMHNFVAVAALGGILTLLTGNQALYAADIFSNAITNSNPSDFNPFTDGQTHHSEIAVTGVGRGPGIGANTGSNRYNARNWSLPSLDANDYFTFTLTPNANFEIDFNSLSGQWQRSGTGPTQFALRTSLDGFAGTVASGSITGDASAVNYNINLSSLQDVTSAIELRLYAWGGSNVAGTFSFNSFTFDGSVNATSVEPEPFAGDYNDDGVVDSADYVTWRKNIDLQLPLDNETETPGSVDSGDYNAWVTNYGNSEFGSGGLSAEHAVVVPEPAAIACFALALCSLIVRSSRKR